MGMYIKLEEGVAICTIAYGTSSDSTLRILEEIKRIPEEDRKSLSSFGDIWAVSNPSKYEHLPYFGEALDGARQLPLFDWPPT